MYFIVNWLVKASLRLLFYISNVSFYRSVRHILSQKRRCAYVAALWENMATITPRMAIRQSSLNPRLPLHIITFSGQWTCLFYEVFVKVFEAFITPLCESCPWLSKLVISIYGGHTWAYVGPNILFGGYTLSSGSVSGPRKYIDDKHRVTKLLKLVYSFAVSKDFYQSLSFAAKVAKATTKGRSWLIYAL